MCSSVILACKRVCVCTCLISLSGFGIGVMLASQSWKSSSSCDFLEEFLKRKSVLNIHCKDWGWSWNSDTLATWCKELTHWKRPWWWERLKAGGEGDDRGWDGWMASPTWWTWVWVNSGSGWWTGRPGVLIHGVAKNQTRLSDWRTGVNSSLNVSRTYLGSQASRVVLVVKKMPANQCRSRLDPWVGKIPGRRAWQPTPAFFPGKSHRQKFGGYRPQERRVDTMEAPEHSKSHILREAIWSWTFICWEFWSNWFNFIIGNWSVPIFYFFWVQS